MYNADHLLNYASESCSINAPVARVGQIAGAEEGQGTWLDEARADAEAAGSTDIEAILKAISAVKVLGFYEGFAGDGEKREIGISRTENANLRLRVVGDFRSGWIGRWASAWLAVDGKGLGLSFLEV